MSPLKTYSKPLKGYITLLKDINGREKVFRVFPMDDTQPLVVIFFLRKDIFALQMNNSNLLLAYNGLLLSYNSLLKAINGPLKTYNESMQSVSEALKVAIVAKASINRVPMAIIRWQKDINSLLKVFNQWKPDIFPSSSTIAERSDSFSSGHECFFK